MSGHGIDTQSSIDWAKLMEFKRSFTEPVPELREKAMEKIGITPIHGEASFTGKDTIVVNGDTYQAKHFLIATGAKPAPLPIKGGEHLTTSTEFLELDALPETIVFVGGDLFRLNLPLLLHEPVVPFILSTGVNILWKTLTKTL